ncbi:beta-lactamase family protein [bacterium]|nr:MAG: beta-lactamase family protein [bacterium]
MASVTKSFTALAIRQLDVAGKLNLDDPVQTYLPQFQLADQEAAADITVRNLLNHVSGISTVEGDQPYVHSPKTTFEQLINQLADYQPAYPVGEQYQYSNLNYVLLGQVISAVSGQTYEEYVQQNILAPLEMSNSTFADYHTIPQAATGNLITYGITVPYDEPHVPLMVPAASLNSTAEDMAHYLSLFFGKGQYHGESLLSVRGQGWYDPWWNWQVGQPEADLVYGFSGGSNSISTTCLLYPGKEIGIVILLNTRLDQLSPAITAYDIARGIGNIIVNQTYEVPSSRGFYASWALVDGIMLLLIISLVWQVFRLKKWRIQYRSANRIKKTLAWMGIVFDILIIIAILYFPSLAGTQWNTLLYLRPDFAVPLLLIASGFGAIGIMKIIFSIRQPGMVIAAG